MDRFVVTRLLAAAAKGARSPATDPPSLSIIAIRRLPSAKNRDHAETVAALSP